MSDLRDLYQEIILDHGKRPRNHRAIDGGARKAEGANPLCGDRVRVYVKLEGDVIADASFLGSGCAISTASASLMTDSLKGKTTDEAKKLLRAFVDLVKGLEISPRERDDLGKLASLSGVCAYPVRVKCATLAWHTLLAALEARPDPVTTE